jgi:transposase
MTNKIKVKHILELRNQGLSMNQIAHTRNMSKHSVGNVYRIADERGITFKDVESFTDDVVYKMFFPDKHTTGDLYENPNYEHVHCELRKTGVTLKLLHAEHLDRCKSSGSIAMGYTKFCKGYSEFILKNNVTNHLLHKPGVVVEVDWSGPTMSFTEPATGEIVKAYLFVSTLPYSQYSYVEPTLDMKQDTWLQCHVNMWGFYGGVASRTVCDNLKTGVVSHPREGDIILNDAYESLGLHYLTAIMPTDVRKPKQKASVEGSVGKIATAIIARLRNVEFNGFTELRIAVSEKLREFNEAAFQKREGSRSAIFQEEESRYLHALPSVPFELSRWYYGRKVQLNSHVDFEKNHYSCFHKYVGMEVDLKVSKTRIDIYCKGSRVKTHLRFPTYAQNQYRTDPEDMPEWFQRMEWDDTRIKGWATSIGKHTLEVVEKIFNRVLIKEQAYKPALSVLNLAKAYSNDRLETACELALTKIQSPRYHHLKPLLSSNQDIVFLSGKEPQADADEGGYVRGAEYYGGKKK